MHEGPLSHLQLPDSLADLAGDDPRAATLLTRWDELPEARVAELFAHPVLGPRLARLRAAEAWLGRGLRRREARAAALPPADDLYRFGGGPGAAEGARLLPLDRRRAVERHLAEAPEEAAWVSGLRQRPPSPLLFDAPALDLGEGELEEDTLDEAAPRRRPTLARWAPLAAAALAIALGLDAVRSRHDVGTLPERPLLRAPADEPLLHPRGRVLAAPEGAVGLFASAPRYALRAVPEATEYRVVVRRHSGGAFDAGEVTFRATAPVPEVVGAPLAPGHYEWEGFATRAGLEHSLGTLSFQVVEAPEVLQRFARETLRDQVQNLDAAGFETDAWHRAALLGSGSTR